MARVSRLLVVIETRFLLSSSRSLRKFFPWSLWTFLSAVDWWGNKTVLILKNNKRDVYESVFVTGLYINCRNGAYIGCENCTFKSVFVLPQNKKENFTFKHFSLSCLTFGNPLSTLPRFCSNNYIKVITEAKWSFIRWGGRKTSSSNLRKWVKNRRKRLVAPRGNR